MKYYVFARAASLMGISMGRQSEFIMTLYVLIGLTGGLIFWITKQYLHRIKTEKKYKETQQSLQESLMELESANLQLVAGEEELNRQFLEIRDQKEKLKISRERYRLAVDGAEVGIWDLDLLNHQIYVSKKGNDILGFEHHDVQMNLETIKEKIIPSDLAEVRDKYIRHVENSSESFEVKCRVRVKDDKYSWISIRGRALRDEEGKAIRMAGSLSNINKEKVAEAKIRKLAFYDSLTDLPNKAYFNQLLDDYIQTQHYNRFAIFLIDIDNFKAINDSLGHSFGDEVIIKVSKLLKGHLNKEAELIRFGGDEFVIIVPNIATNKDLIDFADGIVLEFSKPLLNEDLFFPINISMGIATYPFDGQEVEELFKHAEMALYDVKVNGKNGYRLFSFELDQAFNKRLTLERDLRKAISDLEFELYYQPKLDIAQGKVLGYEALLRWHHPEKGMVSPIEFIPLAEETGLIIPIGEWVILQAVNQLQEWHSKGLTELTISVNLSARQFKDIQLLALFKRIHEQQIIDMTKLELEITETTALEDVKYAVYFLNELKALGIKLSLDDFGTGYSSLNYLMQLPIDYLKIDKSFINNIIMHRSGEEIIKSVIALAHAFNIKVVAEGVETEEQMAFLISENCDMIQGYYISRPVPIEEAIELINIKYY